MVTRQNVENITITIEGGGGVGDSCELWNICSIIQYDNNVRYTTFLYVSQNDRFGQMCHFYTLSHRTLNINNIAPCSCFCFVVLLFCD